MKLAIFFHCVLQGVSRPIDIGFATHLLASQMDAIQKSGLSDACHEFHIGVNGDDNDVDTVRLLVPRKAVITSHGKDATTEIPTMSMLRNWLPEHRDWAVLYAHMKGVTHPPLDGTWRRGMEHHLFWNWQRAVSDISNGYDACGCHWLTPERWPGLVSSPFFGGNYWHAKASYLLTLPPLPEPTWDNRYMAETWIGSGPRRPRVIDYSPGWPPHSP
jgi:hypothetical protein